MKYTLDFGPYPKKISVETANHLIQSAGLFTIFVKDPQPRYVRIKYFLLLQPDRYSHLSDNRMKRLTAIRLFQTYA
jgi:hypothetical protein